MLNTATKVGNRRVRVLAMNTGNSEKIRDFFKHIADENSDLIIDFATYKDVVFSVIGGKVECSIVPYKTALSDYDLIYFKTYFRAAEIALAMATIADHLKLPFFDREVQSGHARTKLTQYVKLANAQVAVPNTIVASVDYLQDKYEELRSTLGEVFVMKDVAGERGEKNYLVTSSSQFFQICQDSQEESLFACQQYIKSNGDYRLVVLGDSVKLIIMRKAKDADTYLTNTSSGGSIQHIEVDDFDPQGVKVAVDAAAALNRQVAGVDLIFNEPSKEWFVLEVNNSPNMADHGFLKEKRDILGNFLRQNAKD